MRRIGSQGMRRALLRGSSALVPVGCSTLRMCSADIPPSLLAEIDRRIQENYQRTLDQYTEKQHTRKMIEFYASMLPAKVNLNEIVVWLDNPNYDPYIFCHRQLPILLAHLVQQLQDLPIGLSSMPSIHATKITLIESFSKLAAIPVPDSFSVEKRYIEALKEIDDRHAEFDLIVRMATGIVELKSYIHRHKDAITRLRKVSGRASITGNMSDKRGEGETCARFATTLAAQGHIDNDDFDEELLRIQEPIDRFNKIMIEFNFLSRQLISFADRMAEEGEPKGAAEHASCMTMKRPAKMSNTVDLQEIVKNAVYDARQICEAHYGDAPDVVYDIHTQPVVGQRFSPMPAALPSASRGFSSKSLLSSGSKQSFLNNPSSNSTNRAVVDGGNIYAHICPTVHYVVVELMKNALRATIEAHMKRNAMGVITCDAMPPVRVTINARRGLQHSCVCVEDRGTGIKRGDMSKVMSYSYTTAKSVLDDDDEETPKISNESVAPLAGYGYGLPMSRAYARSFGGDILVQSVEGYGTRVSLYLLAAVE